MSCIFCKIARREIPSTVVLETESVLAFRDLHPQAPTHVLVIPKEHVSGVGDLQDAHQALAGQLLLAARDVAAQLGLSDFRIAANHGAGAGQSVFHLHIHVLGGRAFDWPPG